MRIKALLCSILLILNLTANAEIRTRVLNVPSSDEIMEQFDVNRDNELFDQESIATAIYLSPVINLAVNTQELGFDYSASLFLYMMKYKSYPTILEIYNFHYYEDKRGIVISKDLLNEFLSLF